MSASVRAYGGVFRLLITTQSRIDMVTGSIDVI